MRYAIYFIWNDGVQDSYNVSSAKERDFNLKSLKSRDEFVYIAYSPIYASGEYGKRVVVLDKRMF